MTQIFICRNCSSGCILVAAGEDNFTNFPSHCVDGTTEAKWILVAEFHEE